jgi:mannose-6-phosphate isomerase-like protein (cupin superfamily)
MARSCANGARSLALATRRGSAEHHVGGESMTTTIKKNLGTPDETRAFPNGKLDVVKVGALVFGKATFEPGWKWSECVKPIAGTASCMVHHNGYIVSGRMHIKMDDGTETELGPGDVFVCPPGHDAWIVSKEPCVAYDFSGAETYAKKA